VGSRDQRAAAHKRRGIPKTWPEMSEERSNTMTPESIEQLKARLKREDQEKEEAFQKHLEEIKAGNARWRAEQEEKERAKEQERQKLHEDLRQNREQEMKDGARLAWPDAGGREEEFEREWSEMRRQMLRERAAGGDSEARQEFRQRNVRAF
jgi:hypothetical protein